ncbi:hypothetical protein Tco_0571990, partial [Tanacetum coccineum]
ERPNPMELESFVIYKTDALASSWGCPKTKLRREDEQKDIPKGVYE